MIFHVLGLGETVKEFRHAKNFSEQTIGVNDVWKWHMVHYLVIVDRPERFTEERKKVIYESRQHVFFSQHDWGVNSKWCKLKFDKLRGSIENIAEPFNYGVTDENGLKEHPDYFPLANNIIPDSFPCPHSISSPFVAACIAYKLGATEIVLWGCDYVNHPNFKENGKIERVKKDFSGLKTFLDSKNIQIRLGVAGSGALSEILK